MADTNCFEHMSKQARIREERKQALAKFTAEKVRQQHHAAPNKEKAPPRAAHEQTKPHTKIAKKMGPSAEEEGHLVHSGNRVVQSGCAATAVAAAQAHAVPRTARAPTTASVEAELMFVLHIPHPPGTAQAQALEAAAVLPVLQAKAAGRVTSSTNRPTLSANTAAGVTETSQPKAAPPLERFQPKLSAAQTVVAQKTSTTAACSDPPQSPTVTPTGTAFPCFASLNSTAAAAVPLRVNIPAEDAGANGLSHPETATHTPSGSQKQATSPIDSMIAAKRQKRGRALSSGPPVVPDFDFTHSPTASLDHIPSAYFVSTPKIGGAVYALASTGASHGLAGAGPSSLPGVHVPTSQLLDGCRGLEEAGTHAVECHAPRNGLQMMAAATAAETTTASVTTADIGATVVEAQCKKRKAESGESSRCPFIHVSEHPPMACDLW